MDILLGRLGLETARIPHKSRQGLLYLQFGSVSVEDGCIIFETAGFDDVPAGTYGIPHQGLSAILLGPGTSISHDALRILANHGTGVIAIGMHGVRIYSAPPLLPDKSRLARSQAEIWADPRKRDRVVRKMYGWRMGRVLPSRSIEVLRGIEGSRAKRMYEHLAEAHGIQWRGRRFDRANPGAADVPNQAVNHAATAMYAASAIAVYSIGAIPQLGFIHEASGDAFCLDIADLYRDEITLPIAFSAVKELQNSPSTTLEKLVRYKMSRKMSADNLIDDMIRRIKELFDEHDGDPNQVR